MSQISLPKPLQGIELGLVVPTPKPINPKDKGTYETYLGAVITESGKCPAYIKLLNLKALSNELVACVLGKSLGLPVPDGYLLRVKSSDIPSSQRLLESEEAEHFAFACKAIKAPSLYSAMNWRTRDCAQFLKENDFKKWEHLIVFDDWIANIDRYEGNLLVGTKKRFWWIDHSHSFTDPDWKAADLKPDIAYTNAIASIMDDSLEDIEKMALISTTIAMKANALKFALQDIGNASRAYEVLDEADLEAIVNFVIERVNHLHEIMCHRLGESYQQRLRFV